MHMREVNTFYTPEFWATVRDSFATDKSPSTWKTIKTARLDDDQTNLKNGDRTFITRLKLIKKLK